MAPDSETDAGRRLLTGWGRTQPVHAKVVAPADADAVGALMAAGRLEDLVIARGLGRSYGDAAQCAGGTVVDTTRLSAIGQIDAQGIVTVGAGTRLGDLTSRAIAQGWFVPVTPGTEEVTIGGAIAANVHGKNHHRDGSFSSHVRSLTLATPTGVHRASPVEDPELFWATAGGMGMTGIVVEATVQLTPVTSSWMVVDTLRFESLDDLMSEMTASDADHRYSVAWVDCMASGSSFGRGVLTRGDHAAAESLDIRRRAQPLAITRRAGLGIRVPPPGSLVNRRTASLFNDVWFRCAPRRRFGALRPMHGFFYPLDGLRDWNLLYGRHGLVQYQFVVGDSQGEVVRDVIARISGAGLPATLAVLKRFGAADPGPLSFPKEGWTLALDFPVGPPGLARLLDGLDELVAGAAGRVYLAKDARLRPDLVPLMYPRLTELRTVCQRVDPAATLGSDLSRRLGLRGLPSRAQHSAREAERRPG